MLGLIGVNEVNILKICILLGKWGKKSIATLLKYYLILYLQLMLFCCDLGLAIVYVVYGVKLFNLKSCFDNFLTFGMSAGLSE